MEQKRGAVVDSAIVSSVRVLLGREYLERSKV
jgi:hypothetical protein